MLFLTKYILLSAGHTTVPAPDKATPVSVRLSIAARDSAGAPSATVSVWELVVQVLIVAIPATAVSSREVICSLITFPQLPVSSPCTGKANPNLSVY